MNSARVEGQDTICAVITSPHSTVRSAIRVSGPRVPALYRDWTGRVFGEGYGLHMSTLKVGPLDVPTRLLLMPEGRSYTKEAVVELHFPSNASLIQSFLQELYEKGIRPAGPGEFTRRAYLNGRVNLNEAQSIAALVAAEDQQHRSEALRFLNREEGDLFAALKSGIFDLRRDLEATIDFPEEPDIEAQQWRWQVKIDALEKCCHRWHGQGGRQLSIRPVLRVLILGPANAGKSSLVRRLIPGSQPVISHVEGTTLDLIPYTWEEGGASVLLYDSPGLKSIDRDLDRLSLGQLEHRLNSFDAYLLVSELGSATEPSWPTLPTDAWRVRIFTKADVHPHRPSEGLVVSSTSGEGVDALKAELQGWSSTFRKRPAPALSAIKARLLDLALEKMQRLKALLIQASDQEELAAYELDELLDELDGAVGEEGGGEALLDSVFRDFCIGK